MSDLPSPQGDGDPGLDVPLTDWQVARYGDRPETRAALAFYRERGWPVDERDAFNDEMEARIQGFKSGWQAALTERGTP